MAIRVLGTDLKRDKIFPFALAAQIYGIGIKRAMIICEKAGIDPKIRVKDLHESDAISVQNAIKELGYIVANDLQRERKNHDRRLASIRCYRWLCRERGIPSRGQRSRSNGNTAHRARKA